MGNEVGMIEMAPLGPVCPDGSVIYKITGTPTSGTIPNVGTYLPGSLSLTVSTTATFPGVGLQATAVNATGALHLNKSLCSYVGLISAANVAAGAATVVAPNNNNFQAGCTLANTFNWNQLSDAASIGPNELSSNEGGQLANWFDLQSGPGLGSAAIVSNKILMFWYNWPTETWRVVDATGGSISDYNPPGGITGALSGAWAFRTPSSRITLSVSNTLFSTDFQEGMNGCGLWRTTDDPTDAMFLERYNEYVAA